MSTYKNKIQFDCIGRKARNDSFSNKLKLSNTITGIESELNLAKLRIQPPAAAVVVVVAVDEIDDELLSRLPRWLVRNRIRHQGQHQHRRLEHHLGILACLLGHHRRSGIAW